MKPIFPREISYKAIKIYKKLKHTQVMGCFMDEGTVNTKLPCICQMAYGEVEVQFHSFLRLALDRDEWSALHFSRCIRSERARYTLSSRLGVPAAYTDTLSSSLGVPAAYTDILEEINTFLLPEFEKLPACPDCNLLTILTIISLLLVDIVQMLIYKGRHIIAGMPSYFNCIRSCIKDM